MIKAGDTLPSMKLMAATPDGPREISTDDIFHGKRVVLFAVPGAFTPTCSARHLPGFVENAAAFKEKGIDSIVCLAVNDAFVMGAWAKAQDVGDAIIMLADGSAQFTKALGLELDLVSRGLGVRSQRFRCQPCRGRAGDAVTRWRATAGHGCGGQPSAREEQALSPPGRGPVAPD